MAREIAGVPTVFPRVDWSRFDTGTQWELLHGEDFAQTPRAAAHAVRQWASRRGRRATVHVRGDRLTLFIHPQ
jgi:hypothetical protein